MESSRSLRLHGRKVGRRPVVLGIHGPIGRSWGDRVGCWSGSAICRVTTKRHTGLRLAYREAGQGILFVSKGRLGVSVGGTEDPQAGQKQERFIGVNASLPNEPQRWGERWKGSGIRAKSPRVPLASLQ